MNNFNTLFSHFKQTHPSISQQIPIKITSQPGNVKPNHNYMQGQKNQFNRKQRKLFSRDRSGLNRNNSRLKSKESEDRLISDHNSPKPKYLILGLRNELTSLREEVAKLSQRDKAPQQHHDILLEYKSQSPRDKKNVHHYLEESTSQSRRKEGKHVNPPKPPQEPLQFKSQQRQPSVEMRSLAVQLKDSRKVNKELEKANQSLRSQMKLMREQLKGEYEGRLLALEDQRESKENDRTVIIQRQNQQQQEVIIELRENINSVTRSNAHLKEEVEKLHRDIQLMKNSEQDLLQKREEIHRLDTTLQLSQSINQQLQIQNQNNSQQIQQLQAKVHLLEEERTKNVQAQIQLRKSCLDLETQNGYLKKKIEYYEAQERIKMDQRSRAKIKELEGVIRMQEKSIENYESDLRFLQKEVRKASFMRSHSHNLNVLVEDLTAECIKLQCQKLSNKYSR